MSKLEFKIPEGYELDKEKSTDETIIYKKKEKENQYPLSVDEIKDRMYFISDDGRVLHTHRCIDINNVSTRERAEAFRALMQLVELRDAWNEIDGFEVDWTNCKQKKYCIENYNNDLHDTVYYSTRRYLHFGSRKTRDLFRKTFKDLIETAKELL